MTLDELFQAVDGRPLPAGVHAEIRSFQGYDEVTWSADRHLGGWFWAVVQGSEVTSFGHAWSLYRMRMSIATAVRLTASTGVAKVSS